MTGSLQLVYFVHVVLICQEELVALQKQLEEREQELRRLKEQAGAEVTTSDGSQSRERGLRCSIFRRKIVLPEGILLHTIHTLTTLDKLLFLFSHWQVVREALSLGLV